MSTIMLVDDSATILLSIAHILAKAGSVVERASHIAEGLVSSPAGSRWIC